MEEGRSRGKMKNDFVGETESSWQAKLEGHVLLKCWRVRRRKRKGREETVERRIHCK
jgi:hypothetical protein